MNQSAARLSNVDHAEPAHPINNDTDKPLEEKYTEPGQNTGRWYEMKVGLLCKDFLEFEVLHFVGLYLMHYVYDFRLILP